MLTSEGHIQMLDFGISAEEIDDHYGLTSTFCGTSEFLTSEICFCGNRNRLPSLEDLIDSADSIEQEVRSRSRLMGL